MSDEKTYFALPTLRKFHESAAQIRCIVGPVGSGKTSGATWEICYYLPQFVFEEYGIKNTRWCVVRNTYPELRDTTMRTVFDWFPWGRHQKQENIYILVYPEGFTVEILFRSCDNPQDVKKFKSLEITGYWIDESIEVGEEIKRMLKNRIGRFPQKCPVRFGIETTNPPDVEHPTYTDFEWSTTGHPGPISTRKSLENHAGFWQPPGENNANLRPGYYADLVQDYAGSPDWIARYIRGEPGITIQGKQVYNNFRRSIHVTEQLLVWAKGPLFAGWDNTGNCPACVVCQIPTAGIVHVLGEYHTEKMGIVDFVKSVVLDRNSKWPDAEWTEWGDPAGEAKFSKKGGGLTSNAELMKEEAGIQLKSSEQNWDARRESVESQLGRMVAGEPALLIDPSCVRLINGFLGGYAYPEQGTTGIYGDKPIKNKYSHVHDALQYVMVMLNRNVMKDNRSRRRSSFTFTNWSQQGDGKNKNSYQEVYVS